MIRVFNQEYQELLSWNSGYVKYRKGRIKIAFALLMSMFCSSIVLIGISLGTWLYIVPIFFTLQLTIAIYNLLTCRKRYLALDHVREIGFLSDGSFNGTEKEKQIYLFVLELSSKLNLKKPPKVAIVHTDVLNAYAVGSSRNKGLILITSSALEQMSMQTLLSTVAHEMAHIVNGDAVGMMIANQLAYAAALLLGLPVKILTWPIAETIERWLGIDHISYVIHFLFSILVDYILLSVMNLFVLAYSRRREFRADLLEAKMVGKEAAIKALNEWKRVMNPRAEASYATLGISGNLRRLDLFSTHPSWERRIKFVEKKLGSYDANLMKV